MKTKHYVAVAAFATLAMAGCTGQKNATNTSGIDLPLNIHATAHSTNWQKTIRSSCAG